MLCHIFPLNHGNNSATLHFICLLLSFRSFGAVDSTSTLIISNIVPICWFGQSWLFCFLSDLFCYLASAFACLAVDAPSATRSATTRPCSSSHVKMFYGLGSAMAKMACSLCSVTITYLRISMVCLSRKNQALNSKALQTCAHLAEYIILLLSGNIIIILHRFENLSDHRKLASILFHVVPPSLNAIIYGRQIKAVREKNHCLYYFYKEKMTSFSCGAISFLAIRNWSFNCVNKLWVII